MDLTTKASVLQAQIDDIKAKIGYEDPKKIVDGHIKLLHEYNEAKDAAQILIGKLAAVKQTTVRQIHDDYGLTSSD